jgi:serine/arginine repetitive matrix protein 2
VRSIPPHSIPSGLPDPKLAMMPENIKPLLENAKEVHLRLNQCIAEIGSLLSMHADIPHV